MTDDTPTLAHGDEYVVLYTGGPNDGQSDRRISTDGGWDEELTVLALVSGKETMENYNAVSWTEVGGVYHVTYAYDEAESEPGKEQGALGFND
ncbi:MAG: oligoribonuclease [Microbacteriaceae bacterium]|jgi:hypothetical protein|nr:oligoribonuclease [Microbacteriaceae bacterium]